MNNNKKEETAAIAIENYNADNSDLAAETDLLLEFCRDNAETKTAEIVKYWLDNDKTFWKLDEQVQRSGWRGFVTPEDTKRFVKYCEERGLTV